MKFGIAFYRKEQWELFRSTADDADDLEGTYEEWLKSVEELEMKLTAEGYATEKVDIDVNDLIQWCRMNGKDNTSKTRSEYTAMLLKKRSRPPGR